MANPKDAFQPPPKFSLVNNPIAPGPQTQRDWDDFIRWLFQFWKQTSSSVTNIIPATPTIQTLSVGRTQELALEAAISLNPFRPPLHSDARDLALAALNRVPPPVPKPQPEAWARTLLIYDTRIGLDTAPNVVVQESGSALSLTGVLRAAIAADLTVVWNLNASVLITATIPAATPIKTPVIFPPADFALTALSKNDVLGCDITASDDSWDASGVASFTLEWQ